MEWLKQIFDRLLSVFPHIFITNIGKSRNLRLLLNNNIISK